MTAATRAFAASLPKQLDLHRTEGPGLTWPEVAQLYRPYGYPPQPHDRMVDRLEHLSNLPVSSLPKHNFEPGVIALLDPTDLAGGKPLACDPNSSAQSLELLI